MNFIVGSVSAATVLLLALNTSFGDVTTWTRWEHTLTSGVSYPNPYQQVTLAVTYTGPDSRSFQGYGFWDGGQTFKLRFLFPTPGLWTWRTTCSDAGNTGLHDKSGTVDVAQYVGDHPLYKKGYLTVSRSKRYLAHDNGDAFLWIGDTPWSAFVTATQEEWERYLHIRKESKFTVVQVHCGGCWDWVGKRTADRYGNPPFAGEGTALQWNPSYWQQVDRKVQAANELGLLVYVCAVRQPGAGFPTDDSEEVARFAQNLAARLMGSYVIYSPIADDLWTPQADAAGNALDRATTVHLISAHPRFFLAPAITFHGKDYIDVVGLQTGEGWTFDPYKKEAKTPFSTPLAARQAVEFPLALYGRTPVKPVINQEGPYDHPLENGREPLPPRKAGYWSFLSGAPGFTYGCFGVWNWGVPIKWFPCYDFPAAVDLPSAEHMTHLAKFFGAIRWWTLEPRHKLVQNPSDDPMRKIVLAKNPEGDLAVAYLPDNAVATIDMKAFPSGMEAQWFNPMTGAYQALAEAVPVTGPCTFTRPAGWHDAVLLLTRTEP